MAVIALTSAKGSPGVTTAALALTHVWPRPVLLIEADVAGGSSILAGWQRSTLTHDRSLLDAAIAHRHGELADRLFSFTFPIPVEAAESPKRFLPAIPKADQRGTLGTLWTPLAQLVASISADAGTDVIVDAGRLGADNGPAPLLHTADAVLMVSRAHLAGISAAAATVESLKSDLGALGTGADTLALVTVGQPGPGPSGSLYSPAEVRKALRTPVLGTIAYDPVAAEVFSAGATPHRRFDQSRLMKSVRAVADAAAHLAQQHQARIQPRAPRPAHVTGEGL